MKEHICVILSHLSQSPQYFVLFIICYLIENLLIDFINYLSGNIFKVILFQDVASESY